MKFKHNGDKRRTGRTSDAAVIRYSVGEEESRTARMFNYSNSGMYLEIDYPPPKLGASLLIEVQDPLVAGHDAKSEKGIVKTCYYAQVIWKKNLPDSDKDYGVGLRYLDPTSQEQ
jgi:hypothetical protein